MELHIKIAGILLVLLSILHLVFPARFKWKEELGSLSLINRQLMYVHTFFIGLVLLLMGLLCLSSAKELESTALGKQVCLGLSIFWLVRLYVQFFVYSPLLWKGKKFETGTHIAFSFLWIYFTFIFFMAFYQP